MIFWKNGTIPDEYEFIGDGLVLVRYVNAEDGGIGYGLACSMHDMAGVPFVQLTDGGDIPNQWTTHYCEVRL